MTNQQIQQLARAAQIAARDGLTARRGTCRADGSAVYAVLSRSASAAAGLPVYHLLTVAAGRIVCTCPAAQHDRICAHRAAVRAAIEAERTAERTAAPVATAASRACPRVHGDDRPVSIWRAQ